MSYNKDGLRHPTHFLEAAKWGYSVRVDCSKCSNMAIFEAQNLWAHFHKKGWDDSRWAALGHFFCTKCAAKLRGRVRPNRITYVKLAPTVDFGSAPSEYEAQKAWDRLRY